MGKSTDAYTNIILEEMNAKFDLVMEVLLPMQKEINKISLMEEDIRVIKGDINTIKATLKITNTDVRRHNQQLSDHEHRIGALEAVT